MTFPSVKPLKPLSDRLTKIFDCAQGDELWDVGCDHGLLAAYNIFTRKFQRVICVDRSAIIIENLPNRFMHQYRIPLENMQSITFLNQDGRDLDWKNVRGSVVIAGVGSLTIESILRAAPNEDRQRLHWIVVPQDGPESLMQKKECFFNHQNIQTYEVKESRRTKTIMHFSPTASDKSFSSLEW